MHKETHMVHEVQKRSMSLSKRFPRWEYDAAYTRSRQSQNKHCIAEMLARRLKHVAHGPNNFMDSSLRFSFKARQGTFLSCSSARQLLMAVKSMGGCARLSR